MKLLFTTLLAITLVNFTNAQEINLKTIDSLKSPAKVKHAEPLFIDLRRDLGERKGEAEFNIGYGISN